MKQNMKWIGAICCLLMVNLGTAFAFEIQGVDIHGYVSQGYMKTDDNNYLANTEDGTFEFTEVGINFSKEFDKLRIGLQLVSRDLGDVGNNEIELDWAMGDYRFNDYFGLRGGKIKMAVGLYNQERDLDMLRTSIFLPSSVYDEGSRDLNNTIQGANAYGTIDARSAGEVEYEFFCGGINVDEDSTYIKGVTSRNEDEMRTLFGNNDISVSNFDVSVDYVYGGALRWNTPIDGLRLGGSYRNGVGDVGLEYTGMLPGYPDSIELEMDENSFWVLSAEYTWRELILSAEYSQNKLTTQAAGASEESTTAMGWYIQASYRINDWLTAGVYYSEYYPDKDDKDGDTKVAIGYPDYCGWQKEIVPSLRFDITQNFILKAEAHFVKGAAQVYTYNNPDGREKDWNMYVLKATYSF